MSKIIIEIEPTLEPLKGGYAEHKMEGDNATLRYNKRLAPMLVQFVLTHELSHIAAHIAWRKRDAYDKARDAVINDRLRQPGVTVKDDVIPALQHIITSAKARKRSK